MRSWKVYFAFVIVAIMVGAPFVFAALTTYHGPTYTEIQTPTRGLPAAPTTSTAASVVSSEGIGTFVLQVGMGAHTNASWTNSITVQHASASAGTYTPLTNSGGTAVRLEVNTNLVGDIAVIPCDASIISGYVRTVQITTGDTGTASAVWIAY